MKKLFVILVAAVASMTASAITVSEAFDKIAALPGAAVSDVPRQDAAENGMDWGKIVTLMGVSSDIVKRYNAILGEITDEMVYDTVDQNNKVKGYAAKQKSGKTNALVVVETPQGCVVVYAQGDDDVIKKMNGN